MLSPKPLRICIATGDIAGPIRNGGIGTFFRALAVELAAAGHAVTVLYILGEFCEDKPIEHWKFEYAKRNIRLVSLPPLRPFTRPHTQARLSYDAYHWLREQEFDLIHFPEWRGHAFFSLLARRQGLAFPRTLFCVGAHSPDAWHRDGMGHFLTDIEDLQTDHMERTSIALADRVVSPSRYMLRWMEDHGWKLPERVDCIQCMQPAFIPERTAVEPVVRPVSELVFFGRLETRKGLPLFCDALDRIDAAHAPPAVTFLGKLTTIDGKPSRSYIESRSAKWKSKIAIIDSLDHAGALDYLAQPGRLAVVCSLLENSPNTVMECLSNGVPCLASNVGGIPELVDPGDRDRTLFVPRPAILAARLAEALKSGHAPSRPAVHPEATRRIWLEWHEQIARDIQANANVSASKESAAAESGLMAHPATDAAAPDAPGAQNQTGGDPFITVLVTTFNRPDFLPAAIDSLRAQTYSSFEVILIDDGSTSPEAQALLESLQSDFDRRGWRIMRQPNSYPGVARNKGAAAARGQWILVMDDDNVARPHELATFATAARNGSADVYTCLLDMFSGTTPPSSENEILYRWLPLGGSAAAGAFVNCYGDANALIRRDALLAIGGYSTDFGLGYEDWELYARLTLAGYSIQVIPESLFYYRVTQDSMIRTTNRYGNHMRSLRPYLQHVGPQLAGVFEFALGIYANGVAANVQLPANASAAAMNGDPDAYQRVVDEYWDSRSWRISAPVRNAIMRLRGQRPAPRPVVSSRYAADIIVNDIRSSVSWEMTGPLRAMGRLVNALRRQ